MATLRAAKKIAWFGSQIKQNCRRPATDETYLIHASSWLNGATPGGSFPGDALYLPLFWYFIVAAITYDQFILDKAFKKNFVSFESCTDFSDGYGQKIGNMIGDEQFKKKHIKLWTPATYFIETEGHLVESWSDHLAGLHITARRRADQTTVTILVGRLRDQAERSGVLNNLYGLHLSILKGEVVMANRRLNNLNRSIQVPVS